MAEQVKKSRQELKTNLAASFATGVTIITFTNPVDTLKCRWQVLSKSSTETFGGFARNIIATEGVWRGLWLPGLGPNQLAMGCAIGFRNGLYPTVRDSLGNLSGGQVGPTGMFAAGLVSGMCGYALASPLLQVKTQMQAEAGRVGADGLYETGARVGQRPSYASGFQAFGIVAASGSSDGGGAFGAFRALWRGAGVIVGRGAALSASQLMTYDSTKKELKAREIFSDGPVLHVVASISAAVVCTTCSMPLDVVLTVYQSAYSLGGERFDRYGRHGPIACAATMLRESGPSVFMCGWVPAFLRLAPTCVSSFWLYEQLRKLAGIGFLD